MKPQSKHEIKAWWEFKECLLKIFVGNPAKPRRYWKKKLHKAQRSTAKQEIKHEHEFQN